MHNQVTFALDLPEGGQREIVIQAEHDDPKGYGFEHALRFTVWLTPSVQAGFFTFAKAKKYWNYEGHLSLSEQEQIANFIKEFKESDWDY